MLCVCVRVCMCVCRALCPLNSRSVLPDLSPCTRSAPSIPPLASCVPSRTNSKPLHTQHTHTHPTHIHTHTRIRIRIRTHEHACTYARTHARVRLRACVRACGAVVRCGQ